MNKYQEAMEWIVSEYLDIDYKGKAMNKDTEAALCIQELIDKATPKKVAYEHAIEPSKAYKYDCPVCGQFLSMNCRSLTKYCDECGQALEWSDEN